MRIEQFRTVDSTNEYAKTLLPAREDVAVFAEMQTHGRGTKGRSFLSDMGGVYCTFLTFYTDMVPANAFRIMAHAAVAVCRTLEAYSIIPEIKWPNDVRAAGRKIAGILIENGMREGAIDHSIVGIGLNVTNDVSALSGIAVNMAELGASPPVEEVGRRLLDHYLRPSTFEEYLARVHFLGQKIRVTEGEREYEAVARRILSDGRLEILTAEGIRVLSGGEIALLPR